jgi:hypothetical protein
LASRVANSSCPLCRLVIETCRVAEKLRSGERLEIGGFELDLTLTLSSRMRAVWIAWSSRLAWSSRAVWSSQIFEQVTLRPGAQGEDYKDTNAALGSLLPEVPAQVDFARVSSWIRQCEGDEQGHSDCHSTIGGTLVEDVLPQLKTFRLVDVVGMRLRQFAPTDPMPKYVALSYVWGSAATIRLSVAGLPILVEAGALRRYSNRLPRTILDAITAVQKLQAQYLWVDALCLLQNDDEDVRLGVSAMDLIYESSYLTIVAADGHDADAGLPGVVSGSRETRRNTMCQVTPTLNLGIHIELDALLRKSAYYTRGWTYVALSPSSPRCVY